MRRVDLLQQDQADRVRCGGGLGQQHDQHCPAVEAEPQHLTIVKEDAPGW